MARRQLAGRDQKIIQGHRRDEFFARMRRKGGVPRVATQGAPTPESAPELEEETAEDTTTSAEGEATVAEAETASERPTAD